MFRLSPFVLLLLGLAHAQSPYPPAGPQPLPGLEYPLSLLPEGADPDPAIPSPDALLGFPVGSRAASSAEIASALATWAEASPRAELVHYGESWQGRPMHYLVISSPDNLARREAIQQGMAKLGDPREGSAAERQRLIDSLPAVAWFAFGIHGNEPTGPDAALVLAWHLIADRSAATAQLLDEVVVIIDPDVNPDGRERFLHGVTSFRGSQPSVDDQALLHTGTWPSGRMNHFLFDLNRDWIYAIHPETRVRIPHIARWQPLLFVDVHEMGPQDSFLFSPAREPHNPHFPPYRYTLGALFADEQAAAYDRYGYPYYSGEWHEDWYPGYTDAWASLRGAQGILYEQSRMAAFGVQQRQGLISYTQGVHHQLISAFANLETLRARRAEMLAAFAEDRARVVSASGPYAGRSFAIAPGNPGRMQQLRRLLAIQGLEAWELPQATTVRQATDTLGRVQRNLELPAGTLILPNRQPLGRLLAAMFEFDPRLSEASLRAERERLLREGSGTIYDTTAWNIPMMFALTAWMVDEELPRGARRLDLSIEPPVPALRPDARAVAYAVDGGDDRALALAARLMDRGLRVRASDRASAPGGVALAQGSVLVTRHDNPDFEAAKRSLAEVAAELGVEVLALRSGRAAGQLPDLGGSHFRLLERPRVALVGRGGSNALDFGATWFVLDQRLGLRHSHLDEDRLASLDLRRYNVIVLPDRWAQAPLPRAAEEALHAWVRQGGTLIASGAAARALASGESPLSTRLLEAVLDDLTPWQNAIWREWLAERAPLPAGGPWAQAASAGIAFPWQQGEQKLPDAAERKRRDQWAQLFMPRGAIVATRPRSGHWLTAGSADVLPVLFAQSPLLMAAPPAEAVFRVGVWNAAPGSDGGLIGWSPLPEGQELRVRMAGLLWPEAAQRIASSAWLVRESLGRGQVILFAHPPNFRGAQIGAIRVFENAVVFGPGMGASPVVTLP